MRYTLEGNFFLLTDGEKLVIGRGRDWTYVLREIDGSKLGVSPRPKT